MLLLELLTGSISLAVVEGDSSHMWGSLLVRMLPERDLVPQPTPPSVKNSEDSTDKAGMINKDFNISTDQRKSKQGVFTFSGAGGISKDLPQNSGVETGEKYPQIGSCMTPGCALVSLLKLLAYAPNKAVAMSGQLPQYVPPETKGMVDKAKVAAEVLARGDEALTAWLYQFQQFIRQKFREGHLKWPLVCAKPLKSSDNVISIRHSQSNKLGCSDLYRLSPRMKHWWLAPLGNGEGGVENQSKGVLSVRLKLHKPSEAEMDRSAADEVTYAEADALVTMPLKDLLRRMGSTAIVNGPKQAVPDDDAKLERREVVVLCGRQQRSLKQVTAGLPFDLRQHPSAKSRMGNAILHRLHQVFCYIHH